MRATPQKQDNKTKCPLFDTIDNHHLQHHQPTCELFKVQLQRPPKRQFPTTFISR